MKRLNYYLIQINGFPAVVRYQSSYLKHPNHLTLLCSHTRSRKSTITVTEKVLPSKFVKPFWRLCQQYSTRVEDTIDASAGARLSRSTSIEGESLEEEVDLLEVGPVLRSPAPALAHHAVQLAGA